MPLPLIRPSALIRRILPGLLIVGFLGSSAAYAQSQADMRTLLDQLKRMEQDIAALSRTVYRGSPAPKEGIQAVSSVETTAALDPAASDQLFDRLQNLEAELRRTTGKIEVIEHHLNKTLERLELMQRETDLRISRLQANPGAGAIPGAIPGATTVGNAGFQGSNGSAALLPPEQQSVTLTPPPGIAGVPDDQVVSNPIGSETTATAARQQGVLGQISTTEAQQADQGIVGGQQVDQSATTDTAASLPQTRPGQTATTGGQVVSSTAPVVPQPATAPAAQVPTAPALDTSLSVADQYEYSQRLIRSKEYASAEAALRAFIEANSGDPLVPNAQYWLGETLYVRKSYVDAARAFLNGYQQFPESSKAPDSLLKLGMSLRNIGENGQACNAFKKLEASYPEVSASISRRNSREMKAANCATD